MKQRYFALHATIPALVGVSLIGVSSLAAVAQVRGEDEGGFGRRARFEERREQWIEQLNLTETQQAEIQSIREQARAENEELRQELEQAHRAMRSLLESDASAEQIRQQHDQIQQLRQQLSDAMLDVRLDIREVLTEEQRSQLAELLPERPLRQRGGHSL